MLLKIPETGKKLEEDALTTAIYKTQRFKKPSRKD